MSLSVLLTGFLTSLGLILAIGAQNAFVLRQGLVARHVLPVVLVCALSDALLITVGILSFRTVAEALPWIEPAMRVAGAAFLLWFGLRSLRAALTSKDALKAAEEEAGGRRRAILTALALTFANPHVYLDTVILLGSISTRFGDEHLSFGIGAVTASFAFFFTLGFGARALRPLFAKPATWRVLEAGIAVVMFSIAAKLLLGG